MKSNETIQLTDPRNKYASPDYPEQEQPIPGEEKSMRPRADHGESSYKGHGRLKGLVALITGGDSGIGRAVALAYAREGADVAFTYWQEAEDEDAQETERLVKEAGGRVRAHRVDQFDLKACKAVVNTTLEELGRLDILVNNAAFQKTFESIEEITDADLDRTYRVNVESAFAFARAALQHLPPGGSIINTSSIQAFKPSPSLAPYASTKAAIANLTISLAQLAIEKGVRVNAVAPGPVWTPLIPSTMKGESVASFGSDSLFGRPAQPAELAPLYVFLASEEASFITGEIYGVTGGKKQL